MPSVSVGCLCDGVAGWSGDRLCPLWLRGVETGHHPAWPLQAPPLSGPGHTDNNHQAGHSTGVSITSTTTLRPPPAGHIHLRPTTTEWNPGPSSPIGALPPPSSMYRGHLHRHQQQQLTGAGMHIRRWSIFDFPQHSLPTVCAWCVVGLPQLKHMLVGARLWPR